MPPLLTEFEAIDCWYRKDIAEAEPWSEGEPLVYWILYAIGLILNPYNLKVIFDLTHLP